MAEHVQAALDKMVAPLADLMDRNIFSQDEIHAIVARRRDSEYLLRRTTPRKADYLRYIQDEIQLERLRQLRTKKIKQQQREELERKGIYNHQDDPTTKINKHIGDAHIVQHIHLLFQRALRRYNKHDVSLYLQYSDVCKDLHSFQKLPQVYAEAVQLHPHATGLWIEAASHEFFHRTSVSTARILLQRALRINPTAQDLWLQSFALEFHHMAKMKGRQSVLSLSNSNNGGDNKNTPPSKEEEEEEPESLDSTLFVVAKIVYDQAIQAIPKDIQFRLGFLDLCKTFPHTQAMEQYIFKSIRKGFSDSSPKAWIARATRIMEQQQQQQQQADDSDKSGKQQPKGFIVALDEESSSEEDKKEDVSDSDDSSSSSSDSDSDSSSDSDKDDDEEHKNRPKKKQRTAERKINNNQVRSFNEDPVLAMIQKGLQAVPTTEMYLEAVQFLWIYCERVEDMEDEDAEATTTARERILLDFFPGLFLQAQTVSKNSKSSNDLYNPSLAMQHAEYHLRLEQPNDALKVLEAFCDNQQQPQQTTIVPTDIWIALAKLNFQVKSPSKARTVLKQALQKFPTGQPEHLELLLQLLGVELAMAQLSFEKSAAANDGNDNSKECKVATVTFQKVLLLASSGEFTDAGGGDTQADESLLLVSENSYGVTSIEDACFRYLLLAIQAFGPLEGVRKTCNLVLLQSKFLEQLDAKAASDLDKLVAFFDKCLEVEMDHLRNSKKQHLSKAARKKGRVSIRQLCKAAIQLFRDIPSLVRQYQQTQHDALL